MPDEDVIRRVAVIARLRDFFAALTAYADAYEVFVSGKKPASPGIGFARSNDRRVASGTRYGNTAGSRTHRRRWNVWCASQEPCHVGLGGTVPICRRWISNPPGASNEEGSARSRPCAYLADGLNRCLCWKSAVRPMYWSK